MTTRKSTFLFIVILFFCEKSFSQKAIYKNSQIADIEQNTKAIQAKYLANTEILKNLAQKLKLDMKRSLGAGRTMELKGFNEIEEPIYTLLDNNLQAGQTTHTNSIYKGGSLGLDLTGSNPAIWGRLGVWDGGKVLATHVEFGNRVLNMDNTSSSSTHSTHVGGTMAAEGINAIAKGMAPGAQLKSWDYINDDSEMSDASKELLVSNHSYGQVVGWVYNDARTGNQKWEWYGNNQISAFEEYKFGFYDSQSQAWDRIAINAPNYLIVKSAGNKRNENGPGLSPTDSTKTLEKYYIGSSSDSSFLARSRNETFDNLPTYSVAKNILTVGAVSIIPNGADLASEIKISSFSSWGPTDDGRIKPDIVGAGVNLFSPSDLGPKAYTFLSGTSMSSPQVAGSIFLLQDLYARLNNSKMMRSATLKGLVLHTADDAGRPGPDYTYGWGLLNMEKAGNILLNSDKTHLLEELTLVQNNNYTKKIIANGKSPIIATICWTDPEGTPTSASATSLNSRIPKLVNDLDITVSDGTATHQAWILDPNKPANNATKGDNFRDNVEQVYIANPIPGREYTITIKHKSIFAKGSQDYSLVVSGAGGMAYCTSKATSTENTKIEKISIKNITYNATSGCTNYTDNTQNKIEVSPNQTINIELVTASCGLQKDKSYAVFVDWNIDGDFTDIDEEMVVSKSISPENIFKNSFKAPVNIIPGSNTIMRVVVAENGDINPCGSYSNGETTDFLLSYIHPKTDLAITKLVFPDQNICRNTTVDNLSIQLENKGTENINSGEINLKIFENDIEIGATNANLKSPILGLTNSQITIPINITFKAEKQYRFEFDGNINNDENDLNDQFKISRTVNEELIASDAILTNCTNNEAVTLSASNAGTPFWYDAETGGKLIAVGNNLSVKKVDTPTNLYASYNDVSGQMGPKTKKDFAGGTYSGNFGPKPIFHTKAPIVIESARLYIGHSGKIIFTVERISDLTPISSVTLDVTSTRNSSLGNTSNGQQLDDPADPGAIYNLGLAIPEPGEYQISIEYEDNASIFRSNQGVSGFPFNLQNAVTIVGSSFNGTVLKEAWYYFYDLKVRSLGCPSPKRILAKNNIATGPTSTITANGAINLCPTETSTLSAALKEGLQYQWFKDSVAISEANKNTLLVGQKGKYYLQVSDGGICPTATNTINISLKSPKTPIITATGNTLNSSPADSYQWLLSRKPIAGAINQEFTAFETGSYSIENKVDGCLLQSFEVYLTILADEIISNSNEIRLFPNPTLDNIFIENSQNNLVNYHIFNSLGQLVMQNEFNNIGEKPLKISVAPLPAGVYFMKIGISDKVFLKKFVKQ